MKFQTFPTGSNSGKNTLGSTGALLVLSKLPGLDNWSHYVLCRDIRMVGAWARVNCRKLYDLTIFKF